jgi:hypothetical protein
VPGREGAAGCQKMEAGSWGMEVLGHLIEEVRVRFGL